MLILEAVVLVCWGAAGVWLLWYGVQKGMIQRNIKSGRRGPMVQGRRAVLTGLYYAVLSLWPIWSAIYMLFVILR